MNKFNSGIYYESYSGDVPEYHYIRNSGVCNIVEIKTTEEEKQRLKEKDIDLLTQGKGE